MANLRRTDASHVYGNIWQGGFPPDHAWREVRKHFDVLVLCAEEFQPDERSFPGVVVVHVPMDDNFHASSAEMYAIGRKLVEASKKVIPLAQRGARVLVTCALGYNRSGLMTAVLLRGLYGLTGAEAARLIRKARGPRALSNPVFDLFVNYL